MFHVSGILHYMYLNASQKIAGAAMKRLWLAQIGEMPGLEGDERYPLTVISGATYGAWLHSGKHLGPFLHHRLVPVPDMGRKLRIAGVA